MPAKPLKIRLFVEGIEWPVISATVQILPNSPATASIQVVPADSVMEIKPRSLVLLFFYDYYEGRGSTYTIKNVEEWSSPSAVQDNYRLLFAGEIVGVGYTKYSNQRQMILQCMDFSYYWDSCWYFKGGGLFGMFGGENKFYDAAGKTLYDLFFSTGEEIYKTLLSPPAGYKKDQIPGLLGGMVHLLQAIGGVYRWDTKIKGTSKFFTLSELRLKLTQQLGVPSDRGPARLMKKAGFGSVWNKSLKGLGKQFNFRMAINALQRYIFYEVYPNPTPKYVPPSGAYSSEYKKPSLLKNHPQYKLWVDEALMMARSICDLRQRMEDGEKPLLSEIDTLIKQMMKSCKLILKDSSEVTVTKTKKTKSTAIETAGSTVSSPETEFLDTFNPQTYEKTIVETKVTKHNPVAAALSSAIGSLKEAYGTTIGKKSVTAKKAFDMGIDQELAEALQGGPVSQEPIYTETTTEVSAGRQYPKFGTPVYTQFWLNMTKAETKLRSLVSMAVPSLKKEVTKESQPEFLYMQLFRPDLWFCPPPRCNVLFPDRYTGFQYNRTFIKEITRFLIKVPNWLAGADVFFDNYAYAPRIPAAKKGSISKQSEENPPSGTEQQMTDEEIVIEIFKNSLTEPAIKDSAQGGKDIVKKKEGELPNFSKELMPHELYTGVVPHKERASRFMTFGLKGNIAQMGAYQIGYVQRLANFIFFKYRYGNRTIQVNGPFNPWLVAGFPALVVDRPADLKRLEALYKGLEQKRDIYKNSEVPEDQEKSKKIEQEHQAIISAFAGTHYLGQIAQLTHTVSQEGGSTIAVMGYARSHKEQIDPIGADLKEDLIKALRSKRKSIISKKYFAACHSKPDLGSEGCYRGEIIEVTKRSDLKGEYPLLHSSLKPGKRGFASKVEVGVEKAAKEFGAQAVSIAGDPNAKIKFTAYAIVEQIAKQDKGRIDLPFEMIVRPAWYGDCWLLEQIGGPYQELLGIGAITDPISVGDTGGVSIVSDVLIKAIGDKTTPTDEDAYSEGTITELQEATSVKDAVAFIVSVYSSIKQGGYDADEFIRAYTWRPIATMTEIMGSQDLEYDEYGNILNGVEGFFSRSFGDYKNLFLLVPEDVSSIMGLERGEAATERLDVRRERYLQSLAYVLEISERGMRG